MVLAEFRPAEGQDRIILDPPGVARIPLLGGADPRRSHRLPSLVLRSKEWVEIGRRMGWLAGWVVTVEV